MFELEFILLLLRTNLGLLMRQAMFFPTDAEVSEILKEPGKVSRIKMIRLIGGRPPITQEEVTAVDTARRFGYTVTKANAHSCTLREAKDICEYLSAIAAFSECDLRNFVRAIGGYSG